MKVTGIVLKCVAVCLVLASIACLIVAYWDKIMDFFYMVTDKISEWRTKRCDPTFDDLEDCEY